jgi:hypothetical protein
LAWRSGSSAVALFISQEAASGALIEIRQAEG